MQDIFLAIFSILSSFFLIIIFILTGWYIVWKLFLSRFKFVRELLGGINDSSTLNEPKKTKTKKIRRD